MDTIATPQLCRVCGAPAGATVRRSRFDRATWATCRPDAPTPASQFWTASGVVRLDGNGMCCEGTGCRTQRDGA